jgi:uncharacterized protein (TIGR02996 family)
MLALDFFHPSRGNHREECLRPNHLAVLVDGKLHRGRLGARGGSQAFLNFDWWHNELAFVVAGDTYSRPETPPTPVVLNGVEATQGTLEAGDTLRWLDSVVKVDAVKLPSPREWEMVIAAMHSDDAMLVYADWLESMGAPQSAEWARLSVAPQDDARTQRLRLLATRVGVSFRALAARGPIERCTPLCGQRWESLELKEHPWRRGCGTCGKTVEWCPDSEIARGTRGPVVLDPATPRSPGDLLPVPHMVG